MGRNPAINFYSRPCGRGDAIWLGKQYLGQKISTHAPAGGATKVTDLSSVELEISTHAPAGGATGWRARHTVHSRHFYSRPCGRGDHTGWSGRIYHHMISTHAPAGGATLRRYGIRSPSAYFYSRPCGRGDGGTIKRAASDLWISTHAPAGGATWSRNAKRA